MVSDKIKAIIDELGIKQKSIALKAGYTEQAFSRMLTGKKTIKADDVPKLAKALGVSPNDLFERLAH
jgi:transcriptional regulator with XRE-family HTH domain